MENTKKSTYLSVFGIILALGLMASSFILGHQFKNLRQTGVITVKGLAQENHKATIGMWTVYVHAWGSSYANAMANNKRNLNKTIGFLISQGFEINDENITNLQVTKKIEYFTDVDGKYKSRQNGFNSRRNINISTKDLKKLQKVLKEIQSFIAQNQSVTFSPPQYYLENLEKIKRDLIAKATKDAYVRAKEFASTSGVKVGTLKSASQGSFNILSTSPSSDDNSDYGGSYDTSTIDKKVRLVVTIKYAID